MDYGRNKNALALLSGTNLSLKNHQSSNYLQIDSLPEVVLDEQIGISIFKPGKRDDLIDDLKRSIVFDSYPDDRDVVLSLRKEIDKKKHFLKLVSEWGLSGYIDFRYPGETIINTSPTPYYGLLIATVFKINTNNFKNLAASSLPGVKLLKDASLKESITELQKGYSNQAIINYALFESVLNISPKSLKISFKHYGL